MVRGRHARRFVTTLALAFAVVACGRTRADRRDAGGSGRADAALGDGYVPVDLNDALAELDRTVSEKEKAFRKANRDDDALMHMGLGQYLRNHWGLWHDSRLAKWFNAKGVNHADDMSGILLDAWLARLRGEPFDLEAGIRKAQAYWRDAKNAEAAEETRVAAARSRIATLMMDLPTWPPPRRWARLAPRSGKGGVRVGAMTPFRDGVLVTAHKADWAEPHKPRYDYTSPLFFNERARTLAPIRVPELDRIENVVVLGDRLVVEGVRGSTHRILSIAGRARNAIPMPPGKGWVRLASDGDHLLAVHEHSIWRWDGKGWRSRGTPSTRLPWCAVPVVHRDHLYLRGDASLWFGNNMQWLKLPADAPPTSFAADTGLIGAEGPRWEYVWSFAFTPAGDQWLLAGALAPATLLRRGANGRYDIALFHGKRDFYGDLLPRDLDGLSFHGLTVGKNGDVLLAGNGGVYQFDGKELSPLVGLRRTGQSVFGDGKPTDPEAEERGNWHLDPTTILSLGPWSYLLGSDDAGVYLVDGYDLDGVWDIQALDDPLAPPVTF